MKDLNSRWIDREIQTCRLLKAEILRLETQAENSEKALITKEKDISRVQ